LSKTETERGLRLELPGTTTRAKAETGKGRERREKEGGATFVGRRNRGKRDQKTIIIFVPRGGRSIKGRRK
jgi:hypothetical protein